MGTLLHWTTSENYFIIQYSWKYQKHANFHDARIKAFPHSCHAAVMNTIGYLLDWFQDRAFDDIIWEYCEDRDDIERVIWFTMCQWNNFITNALRKRRYILTIIGLTMSHCQISPIYHFFTDNGWTVGSGIYYLFLYTFSTALNWLLYRRWLRPYIWCVLLRASKT